MKARLGVESRDELLSLVPSINEFPLRFLTVHGRVARQMYSGRCDDAAVGEVCRAAKMPVVLNGDIAFPPETQALPPGVCSLMVGRGFVRSLGTRGDAGALLLRYAEASRCELFGDAHVLGRMKELAAYWKELPQWRRKWGMMKVSRTLDEFLSLV